MVLVNRFRINATVVVLVAAPIFLVGCATTPTLSSTNQEVFSKIYSEKPTSVLVLPAINHSTAADAPTYYAASIAQPLTEHGYYVLPIPVTNVMLQQAGISDGEQLASVPPQRLGAMFGADAILFVTIDSWDTSYYVIGGNVTVGLQYRLVSTRTAENLWQYKNKVVVDTTGNSNSGGGLIGALIETAIKTSQQDYFPVAQQVNYRSVALLPHGKFHPQYGVDATQPSMAEYNQPPAE